MHDIYIIGFKNKRVTYFTYTPNTSLPYIWNKLIHHPVFDHKQNVSIRKYFDVIGSSAEHRVSAQISSRSLHFVLHTHAHRPIHSICLKLFVRNYLRLPSDAHVVFTHSKNNYLLQKSTIKLHNNTILHSVLKKQTKLFIFPLFLSLSWP